LMQFGWGRVGLGGMNEREAREHCAELAREHPDRGTSHWVPVEQKDGTWAVARIPLPPPIDPERTSGGRREVNPHEGEDLRGKPWLTP
jgi:hypothetical protein